MNNASPNVKTIFRDSLKLVTYFIPIFFVFISFGQVTTATNGLFSDDATWIGTAPDETLDDILILHDITLDLSLNIQQNFEIQQSLSGTGVNVTVSGSGSLTSGILNIDGVLLTLDDATVTLEAGDTIYADDCDVGNNSVITIKSGAVLNISDDFRVQDDGVLIVEDGGKINVTDDFLIQDNANVTFGNDVIINAEDFGMTDNSVTVFGNGTDINVVDRMAVWGSANVTFEEGSDLVVGDDLLIQDNAVVTVEDGAEIEVIDNFIIRGDADLILDGSLTVGHTMVIRNSATITGDGSLVTGFNTLILNGTDIFGNTDPCSYCIYSQGCSYNKDTTVLEWLCGYELVQWK